MDDSYKNKMIEIGTEIEKLKKDDNVKKYIGLCSEMVLREISENEKQYLQRKEYMEHLGKLDYEKKFHPAMAEIQENIDSQTENPIDISNAPKDADHDSSYGETINGSGEDG